jgi:hypothetical protein
MPIATAAGEPHHHVRSYPAAVAWFSQFVLVQPDSEALSVKSGRYPAVYTHDI